MAIYLLAIDIWFTYKCGVIVNTSTQTTVHLRQRAVNFSEKVRRGKSPTHFCYQREISALDMYFKLWKEEKVKK